MEREIQVFSTTSGSFQCAYKLNELEEALTDIECNGYQVVGISFATDGNIVLLASDLNYPDSEE